MGNGCEQEMLHEALKTEQGYRQWVGAKLIEIQNSVKEINMRCPEHAKRIQALEEFKQTISTTRTNIIVLVGFLGAMAALIVSIWAAWKK